MMTPMPWQPIETAPRDAAMGRPSFFTCPNCKGYGAIVIGHDVQRKDEKCLRFPCP